MFYQTDDYFNKKIQQYGCNFFSCLKISELEAQVEYPNVFFRRQDIENLYQICKQQAYIDEDCVVSFPDDVIQAGFRYLTQTPLTVYQVGSIVGGEKKYWGWVQDDKKDYKYAIYKWGTFTGGEHFNLYDAKGCKLYDSWPKDVEKTIISKILYFIGKR